MKEKEEKQKHLENCERMREIFNGRRRGIVDGRIDEKRGERKREKSEYISKPETRKCGGPLSVHRNARIQISTDNLSCSVGYGRSGNETVVREFEF